MKTTKMLAHPPFKQVTIKGVRKNRLGKSAPDLGNGRDEWFIMPRYALIWQPHTESMWGSCLTRITGTGKRRGDDGPKFSRTMTKVNPIKNGEGGHSATKRERIKGGSQTSIINKAESLSLHPIKDACEWRTTPNMGTILQTRSDEPHIQLKEFRRRKETATPEKNTQLFGGRLHHRLNVIPSRQVTINF